MKNSQYMIEDLQVLAHQGEVTNTNIPFSATQIRDIIRIILDLRGQIIDLEAKNFYPAVLTDEEIEEIAKNNWIWDENNMKDWSVIRFAKAILRKAQEK